MSKKVRIHDLAKQYGMPGKNLAEKLRDLGFSKAKSHMSALDEFEVLQVQGILEAHGIISESDKKEDEEKDETGGGLVLRKKKKKKAGGPVAAASKRPAPTAAPVLEEPQEPLPASPVEVALEPALEAAPVPPSAAEPANEPQPSGGTPEPTEAPAAEVEPLQAPATEEPEREIPVTPAAASDPDVEVTPMAPASAESPSSPSSTAEPLRETSTDAQPVVAGEGQVAPVAPPESGEVTAAETPAAAGSEAKASAKTDAASKKAKGPQPKGRVVGFIDPSSFQRPDQGRRKPESRRLQSNDDTTPDVRPTFTHDRSKAMLRGAGGARGSLTAAQLRERESSRFLRRSRPGGPGARRGVGGGRGPGGSRPALDSPLRGSQVMIDAPVSVAKLADALKLKANIVLRQALTGGIGGLNINAVLDDETSQLLASEFGVELKITHAIAAEEALLDDLRQKRSEVEEVELAVRPPTVAFLGHVDHGKTTLIDRIRETRVAEGEAGGITQHIGAYQVSTQKGHKVTIVDTPGHAAFTSMRARGAKAVDIVVLVVAGDDGVKPHTEEALNHARAAKTPVIVAITKKDKPAYDATRTMQQLATLDLNPEEWGGQTAMLQVSGINGEGIEELLERVFLEGELLELRAHSIGAASGVVLEAEKQQGKGIVAHLLIQDGTLNRGEVILAGEGYGRVRSINDDRGQPIESAGPSTPVEVTGLDALPGVGDAFHVVENLAQAKQVAVERERNNRAMAMAGKREPSANLAAILGSKPATMLETINLIVRADVQGSVEVLRHAISELKHAEVEVKLLHIGVGPITESDIDLAKTSDALLIAFHVGVNSRARTEAERSGLEIRRYTVIYEMLDDLRLQMEGALAPEFVEDITGHVEIRRIFKSSKVGLIAGCMVLDGVVRRNSKVRVLRDGNVVHTGSLATLRREKDEAKEVREGFECGIVLKDFRDINEGDIIETFKMKEVKRRLEDVKKP